MTPKVKRQRDENMEPNRRGSPVVGGDRGPCDSADDRDDLR